MKLPDNADYFVDSVVSTGKQLIEHGFWEMQSSRLDSWYRQFCGPEERYFAACLLDQIIFRSRPQFESALRSLFRSNLNGALFSNEQDLFLAETLKNRTEPKIRLVPVICETDPPTKSGPLVMRRLQRILQLNSKWMCWPWQAPESIDDKGVQTIIFVDDFLGSGRQFVTFFNQWEFDKYAASGVNYFYAPVVAHQQGLDHLAQELSSVNVVCAETLGADNSFFCDKVWNHIGQGSVSADDAKSWYLDFGESRGFKPKDVSLLGYGDLSLVLGFSHSTPNNTLPILWSASAGWQPLLER